MKKLEIKAANKHATTPMAFKPHGPKPMRAGRMLPMAWLMLSMLALSGCGGGDGSTCVGPACPTPAPYVPPEPVGYVGDDVGDYTYKYTSDRDYGTAAEGFPFLGEYHYGYREPDCHYVDDDLFRTDNTGGGDRYHWNLGYPTKIVMGLYDSQPVPVEGKSEPFALWSYRESYDFKRIDGKNMSFTHKIGLYATAPECNDVLENYKKGEITRTGEDTTLPTITNPRPDPDQSPWRFFLLQRTGSTLFTWTGKTVLLTGETVDKFEVDLPALTDRKWTSQTSIDNTVVGVVDLRNKLFNGKTKAKALVYMSRISSSKSNPWYSDEIMMIIDANEYKTNVPLTEWKKFLKFSPKHEPLNFYTLPTQ
jgi:hypothetical protein